MASYRAVFTSLILCVALGLLNHANDALPLSLQTVGGTASFVATTNVPGVEVKGTSGSLSARADVQKNPDGGLLVHRIDAAVPIGTLATGMKLRDEHMRKYIFTTQSGDAPDIRFTAEDAACATAARGYACQLSGQLSLRGIAKPISMSLRVKEQGEGAFHVNGDGLIKLRDYGIEPPSQFGVKPASDVAFHVDFLAKGIAAGAR